MTHWILMRALQELALLDGLCPDLGIAVNVSMQSLQEEDFPATVLQIVADSGVAPGRLTLELTETALILDAERAADALAALSAGGVRLSLDDFGRGYTSLAQLSRFPLDEIKIDKSFVTTMTRHAGHHEIVRALVNLAHGLDVQVVAEGVETDDVLDALVELGCDSAQGYLIARPMPYSALQQWLADRLEAPARLAVRQAVPGASQLVLEA
jgi:EAL domain-containing protein (putative c-di-GMP-specific phosphodiesterase class I)